MNPPRTLRTDAPRDATVRGIVVFGATQLASLMWYYLTHDSPYDVAAFTVDKAWMPEPPLLHDLPVVAFETLPESHPPDQYAILVPTGWKYMNDQRAGKLRQVLALGYRPVTFVSPRARIWPDLAIGFNSILDANAMIAPFVRIGDNCMLMGSVGIGHHSVVGDNCFLAGGVVVGGNVKVGENCVLGLRSTILPGVHVAPRCFIGAGAMVTRDTEPGGVYTGSPARRRKHANSDTLPAAN